MFTDGTQIIICANVYFNPVTSRMDGKNLDRGGSLPGRSAAKTGAQRRHRFRYDQRLSKAAWRFASRRSPKSVVAAWAFCAHRWLIFPNPIALFPVSRIISA
jgi:hypothetical protein